MTTFKRESRYFVLKFKDIDKLDQAHINTFYNLVNDIEYELPHREYVVVESDWPEYEVVWKMLEDRCK